MLRSLLAGALAWGAATVANAAPAMWEASDADSRVVLFGSIHALPPDTDWRTPLFDGALAKGAKVYFEADVGPLGTAALTLKVVIQQLQGPPAPWLDRLTPGERDKLAAALEPLGIRLDEAGTMPPWVLAMQITGSSLADDTEALFDPSLGVESVLQWGLPLERKGYFETPGEQFELIGGGTVEQQIQLLLSTIEDSGLDGGATLGDMLDAWMGGNAEELALVPRTDAERQMLETVLTRRNRNWLPVIEEMLADNEENLIVVGAAHLAGEDSVLDLLADAGYTVRRIQ